MRFSPGQVYIDEVLTQRSGNARTTIADEVMARVRSAVGLR